jgi:hypothetical protein
MTLLSDTLRPNRLWVDFGGAGLLVYVLRESVDGGPYRMIAEISRKANTPWKVEAILPNNTLWQTTIDVEAAPFKVVEALYDAVK